jgi:hypothetical protein
MLHFFEISLNFLCSAFLLMVAWVAILCTKQIPNALALTWLAFVMIAVVCP